VLGVHFQHRGDAFDRKALACQSADALHSPRIYAVRVFVIRRHFHAWLFYPAGRFATPLIRAAGAVNCGL
jgi:hypothetical protein